MQFRQPIYTSELEYLLMGVEGVRAVNYVILTQDYDFIKNGSGIEEKIFDPPLYDTTIIENNVSSPTTNGYGYHYNFSDFYNYRVEGDNGTYTLHEALVSNGTILPSKSPSVFELKNPNQNIKGIVR